MESLIELRTLAEGEPRATRPEQALAACRAADTLVVPKLDRVVRSYQTRARSPTSSRSSVRLNLGGSIHDPTDPVGRLRFNVLAMVAEFESDLIRMRTREGMKVAKAKARLRGKQPKLSSTQEANLVKRYHTGEHTVSELEELFPVMRSTIYRVMARRRPRTRAPSSGAAT
jgi:DNA invertase Pin-like site-specific DNA recombinase